MSALLDSLANAFDARFHVKAPDPESRRASLDAALSDGLPGPRSERWRYTSLRALERRTFAPVDAAQATPAFDAALLADIPGPRVVFVNGLLDRANSDMQSLDPHVRVHPLTPADRTDAVPGADHSSRTDRVAHAGADHVFARMNAALATTGVQIDIDANATISTALHLVFIGAPDTTDRAWHLRHAIHIGRGARATVVEHHIALDTHRHFANTVIDVHVSDDALLTHVRVQDDAAGATQIMRTDATLEDRARYVRLDLELGGALSRHELNVDLRGTDAHAICNGVLLGTGARHLDTRVDVQHRGRDGACDLNWRGLAAGRSRAAFHGGITIHAGADGSRAALSNKNLLLSDTAEIDTQPVLVIHADEVQAAHGATVGQLDANALFYLRSRGLPLDMARALLTNAFCRQTLSVIQDADLHALLDSRLSAALDRTGA